MDQPPSFDEEWMTDWSLWALDHGLPDLPETVRVGESVPVARWVGPRFAAVLQVQWFWSDDHVDDELSGETEMFARVGDAWEPFSGHGGGGWFDPPFRRPALGQREVRIFGRSGAREEGRSCATAEGVVGTDAVMIEVEDEDGVTSRPVESPLGVFVVATNGATVASLRVLDSSGVVLRQAAFGDVFP